MKGRKGNEREGFEMNWFENFDASTLTRAEAEEKLVYVRYLITREEESEKLEGLRVYQGLIEGRLAYFKLGDSASGTQESIPQPLATSEDMDLA
ncbi:hypothetical protein [Rufibacter latericius]|uniref:Uncharacterized protein n=1 Tax=Rufibacter latericius TaxID=2487040 RepID=A0A3M9MET5_9BACT|nr:hypothetical protein [Rufibacter latericius]RNI24082.1 hypothetical protein EFB08_17055 [Rufibacter latericius]